MSNLESPPTEQRKQVQDLQLLQMKLGHAQALLNDKRAKITELENTIEMMQKSQIAPRKLTEEETQCSFEEEHGQQPPKDLRSSEQDATHLEKETMNLHLEAQEMREEPKDLREALSNKEDQNNELRKTIEELEGYLIVSMRDFEFLCNENKTLRERNMTLQQDKIETDRHLSELETEAEKWEQLKTQKQAIMKERLKMQCQQNLALKDTEGRLKEELQIQGDELQRMRQALNTYDWKLFCLQTELDLWAKECKQLKFTNQKQELKIAEMESILKDKQITIFSEQQQNSLLLQKTKSLTSELAKKKAEQLSLIEEIQALKEELAEGEVSKELSYALKEKEQELNQLMIYLKEKISQLDQVKKTNSSLKAQLDNQHHELKNQIYELEQSSIQYVETIENQSKKIEELEDSLEKTRKQCQDNSLLELLRRGEWNQIKTELQNTLAERNQKINALSIEIIERDISSKKNSEMYAVQQKALQVCNKELFSTFIKLEQTESLSMSLQKENSKKEKEIEILKGKIKILKETLQQKEKQMIIFEDQLKKKQVKNISMNEMIQQYQSDLFLKEEENSVLQDKINNLNQRIESQEETQFEFKILNQKLLQDHDRLKMEREDLEQIMRKKEIQILQMKIEVKELFEISSKRIEEMMSYLKEETQEIDETDTFQVLQEENYEVIKEVYQKNLQKLRKVVEDYDFEVKALARRQQA